MKSRELVVTNGRAVFYASMWEDFRKAALDCGWALGLHGSLANDMDIMAMPWTQNANSAEEMVKAIEGCLTIPDKALHFETKKSIDKPNNRTVFTVHIFADFYLDINVIDTRLAVENFVRWMDKKHDDLEDSSYDLMMPSEMLKQYFQQKELEKLPFT